eukprot:9968763-Lingulodinium_polyedra.AAC.1
MSPARPRPVSDTGSHDTVAAGSPRQPPSLGRWGPRLGARRPWRRPPPRGRRARRRSLKRRKPPWQPPGGSWRASPHG